MRVVRTILALVVLVLVYGCANNPMRDPSVQAYMRGEYTTAARGLEARAKEKNESFVVSNVRMGSTCLAMNDLDRAEASFLAAYEVINSVGVNNGGRTVGAVLVSENMKIWKGEPFERAMANYYLGVLYYIRGDYNNSRAALENALFKLRDYDRNGGKDGEYREVESGFVLAEILLGRCFLRLGREDLAAAHWARARELRPGIGALADAGVQRESNVLLFVDYGQGPLMDLEYKGYVSTSLPNANRPPTYAPIDGDLIGFWPRPEEVGPVPKAKIRVDGVSVGTGGLGDSCVDLLALAQERKWQDIDTIRAMKSTAADLAVLGGLAAGGPAGALGAGLLRFGVQPDTRQWAMLPRAPFAIPLHLAPGRHQVQVAFGREEGTSGEFEVNVPVRGEVAVYRRVPGPTRSPPVKWAYGEKEEYGQAIPGSLFKVILRNRSDKAVDVWFDNQPLPMHAWSGQTLTYHLGLGGHEVRIQEVGNGRVGQYSIRAGTQAAYQYAGGHVESMRF